MNWPDMPAFRREHPSAPPTLWWGTRRFEFVCNALTVDDPDGAAFIRSTDYFKRQTITELPPLAAPATTCPQCLASFATEVDIIQHLRSSHATPQQTRRTEWGRLESAQLSPSKAAGGAPEPWSVCEHCGQQYPPRQLSQRFCSPRCRVAHHRARQKAALNTSPGKGHAPPSEGTDGARGVTVRPGLLTRPDGQPAGPKSWELRVDIDPALGLALRRIARMRRETMSVAVERLLRVGIRRFKRTHGTDAFADLPELRSGAGRLGRRGRSAGPLRLVPATPEEAGALIAQAELVGKAAQAAHRNGGSDEEAS